VSAARIPLLVASAARIAAPTPRAPGIVDVDSMLSRWSSVIVSELAALPELALLDWLPPHPAHARVKSSGRTCHVGRRIIVAPLVEAASDARPAP
jgi:hypothetical protein